jgi:hypothetical protein
MEKIQEKRLEVLEGYDGSYKDNGENSHFFDDGWLHIVHNKVRHCIWIGEDKGNDEKLQKRIYEEAIRLLDLKAPAYKNPEPKHEVGDVWKDDFNYKKPWKVQFPKGIAGFRTKKQARAMANLI